MRSSRKGFTLAEVLLTLAIVGIVAALTIPALLNNTNQGELKSAAKKAMSSLNQAIVMGIAQDSTDLSSQNTSAGLATFFRGKLNAISNTSTQVTTADGMIYDFVATGTCPNNTDTVANHTAPCYVTVDVNGSKGSSVVSTLSSGSCSFKDKFYFVLRQSVVIPANAPGNTTWGENCTEQALR